MTPIRWAIAGFGAGGRLFHAPMIAAADGIDAVAALSSNPERAAQARDAGLTVVDRMAELVALGVEGVTITTPAATHAPLAHEALDAGLHVVVDKPFALDAGQAQAVVDHARRARRMLSVYQNRRWDGDFLTVARLIAEGRIGAVRRFASRIERHRPDLPAWITSAPPERGGGVLIDLGPHLIDQAVHLLGPVRTVYAELSRFAAGAGPEDDALVLLGHRDGARSTIAVSHAAAAAGPRFQVNGDDGGLLVDGFDVQESQLIAGGSPLALRERWGREPDERRLRLVTGGRTAQLRLERGRWTGFYPAVVAAIRHRAAVPVDPGDAVHVAAIIDAARRSAAEGRVMTLR